MELDLDAFLDSPLSTDSDGDSDSVPHRTIDEILNDSDSSTPSSPPSVHHRRRRLSGFSLPKPEPSHLHDDAVSDQTLSSTESIKPPQLEPKPGLSTRLKPGEFSGESTWRVSSSRPLPSLFGGVRSNAKPGAALAAAAAASRSVPTPHAAAIKSRMALSGSVLRIVNSGELVSSVGEDQEVSSSNGDLVGAASEVSGSVEKLDEDDERMGDFQSAAVHFKGDLPTRDEIFEIKHDSGDDSPSKHEEADVKDGQELRFTFVDQEMSKTEPSISDSNAEPLVASSPINVEADLDLNDSSISGSFDGNGENAVSAFPREDSIPLGTDTSEKVVLSSPEPDNERTLNGLIMEAPETEFLENGMPSTTEDELGIAGGEDASSISDISELVEERIEQLENERISKRAKKKSQASMKPLEWAEELEKKQASTGFHWEEGAAAQPMRLEGVRRGSTTLGYFDVDSNNTITRTISSQAFRRDHGVPQVLTVHLNYVAVGMTKGVIIVVPSKYYAHYIDNFDSKMLMLGLQGERSHAPVTSMCFNQQGDLLLAGYGNGHVTVWDVLRTSAVKVVTGEHTAPVVHTLFLGQDSQVTRQFKAVTGDSKGLVLLHTFSVVPLLNRFSNKTQCLLDGQRTGTVLSASPLLSFEIPGSASLSSQGNAAVSASSIGSMMGGVVGGDAGWKLFNEGSNVVEEGVVIFVTHQTALVVRLTPNLEVYAQLSKPEGVREGSMPYTAWRCMRQSHGSATESAPAEERVSLLALAWDRKIQVAKLVKSELKVCGKWSLDCAAIGVAWLDDQMLVVLTVTGQLYLFSKEGTVIHQTSFSVDGSGGDDLIVYHTYFTNIYGNPEKAYHNSVAIRGASIYILGPMHLVISRLLPWKERIQVLRKAGDWMGALNMAMTLYDGQAHGVIDLPRTIHAVQEAIMPYLVELLLSYVDEVFSYISVAFCNQIGKMDQLDESSSRSNSVHSEIKEQFTRVGGVAVEFCVHIKRTDILFDEIFSKFVAVHHRDAFLELLEPYILKDMLGSLPPEIMQALVEHYSSKGWLQRVEQCVLHMDISSLDFNQVVRLCREHGLYGALVYLFNKGLDDFRAPLEELLVVLQNSPRESGGALGYRMLVYLKYCFSGLAFPPGRGTLPPRRLPSLRAELLQFLLEDSNVLDSQSASTLLFRGAYLNLFHLLALDTEATLDVLRCAFVEDEFQRPDICLNGATNEHEKPKKETKSMADCQNVLIQNTIDALVRIFEQNTSQTDSPASSNAIESVEAWPSSKDIGYMFEFIAYYVSHQRANVPRRVLSQILEYLILENNHPPSISAQNKENSKRREKQVLALLEVVPETDWDASYVLQLCEKGHFYQVCGLIHTIRHQHVAALDSYMKDVDEPVHAFSFVHHTLLQMSGAEYAAFQSAIISRISELVVLSREGAFFMVIDHFNDKFLHILSELRSHPRSLFLYLKTVMEVHLYGTINLSYFKNEDILDVSDGRRVKDQSKGLEAYLERISDIPNFLRSNPVAVTDDMIELYLELVCQFEPSSVRKFLETFDSYRVEHCLRLCQEYGITDAAAFLLERVGDVGSALLLTLSSLNNEFVELDAAVEGVVSKMGMSCSGSMELFNTILKLEKVNGICNVLHACIGLCQRNTPRLNPEESETLWFRLLDSFCEPLMDSYRDRKVGVHENKIGILAEALDSQDSEEACIINWRISKSHKGAHVLRKLLSQFIKEIVEGMIGYVRLPTIMSKLLSENGSQEFGDFKLTIMGMLGTYGFERRILDTAKSLIEDDTFYTMSLLKKGASHGYAPRSLLCCICNCLLTKDSPGLCIRVFSCGHASHLQCEQLENEALSKRGSPSGCPVCMPKKTTQRSKNKSALADNSLVNRFSLKSQPRQGTGVLHSHEVDALENSYGIQQISRFEILTNLQKDQRIVQLENVPQLKLAPPAIYHEKVKKGTDILRGESSNGHMKLEKPSKNRQLRELKVKGSTSLRFPLKSSIFGKEKASKR